MSARPHQALALVNDRENRALHIPPAEQFEIMKQQATIIAKSGLAPRAVSTPEAVMTIMFVARELDLPPMYALRNIHMIEGKPSLSAGGQQALVLRAHGDDALVVDEASDEQQAVVWYKRRGWDAAKQVTFTTQDAQRAGLLNKDNWRKYPAAMLKARAIGIAATIGFPDVLAGIYQPDELGLETNAEGEPIITDYHGDLPTSVVERMEQADRPRVIQWDGQDEVGRPVGGSMPAPKPQQNAAYPDKVVAANRLTSREECPWYQLCQDDDIYTEDGEFLGHAATDKQIAKIEIMTKQQWGGNFAVLHEMLRFAYGARQLADITKVQAGAVIDFIDQRPAAWVHPNQLGLDMTDGEVREIEDEPITEAEAQAIESAEQETQEAPRTGMQEQLVQRREQDLAKFHELLARATSWGQLQALMKSIKQWGYGKDAAFRDAWVARVKEQIDAGVVAPTVFELPGLMP
jgi:hypothetical protein